MQRLEVSGAVRLIYRYLGVKGLNYFPQTLHANRGDKFISPGMSNTDRHTEG